MVLKESINTLYHSAKWIALLIVNEFRTTLGIYASLTACTCSCLDRSIGAEMYTRDRSWKSNDRSFDWV
jgi:hypothetical protein